jgi:hypothetical protein
MLHSFLILFHSALLNAVCTAALLPYSPMLEETVFDKDSQERRRRRVTQSALTPRSLTATPTKEGF